MLNRPIIIIDLNNINCADWYFQLILKFFLFWFKNKVFCFFPNKIKKILLIILVIYTEQNSFSVINKSKIINLNQKQKVLRRNKNVNRTEIKIKKINIEKCK